MTDCSLDMPTSPLVSIKAILSGKHGSTNWERSMKVNGPRPLDSENAETAYGSLFFHLQKIIEADLRLASADNRYDRAIMGAVVAIRVLIEADVTLGTTGCHKQDFIEWKERYLKWLDSNSQKIFRQKAKREEMRKLAEAEFDRIIKRCNGVYRFCDGVKWANDKSVTLPYYGADGRLEKIPPLS